MQYSFNMPHTVFSSALAVLAAMLVASCSGPEANQRVDEPEAADSQADSAEPRAQPESPTFNRVEPYAALFPADARVVGVVRTGDASDSGFVDRLFGLAATQDDDATELTDEPPLSGARDDLLEYLDAHVGIRPAASQTIVLAAGAQKTVLVVEGEVQFSTPPTPTMIDGHKLLRVDAIAAGFGPVWGVELDGGAATAFFLRQHRALETAKALAQKDLTALDSLAGSERLQTFRRLLAGQDAEFAVAMTLDDEQYKRAFDKLVLEPLGLRLPPPDHFTLTAAETLRASFWGSRATIAEIEREVQEEMADTLENLREGQTKELDRMPLLVASAGLVVSDVMARHLELIETRMTTEAVSYELPLGGVDSGRTLAALLSMHAGTLGYAVSDKEQLMTHALSIERAKKFARMVASSFGGRVAEEGGCTFPPSTTIPATCCPGRRDPKVEHPVCDAPADAWDLDWTERKPFGEDEKQHFTYSFESNGKSGEEARATVHAQLDFNCDGHAKHTVEVDIDGRVTEDGYCWATRTAIRVRNAYE